MTQEVKKFDAEIAKVLHLMINSIYTNKDVAIRELFSNASDACDKLKFLSQTNSALLADDPDIKIKIKVDKDAKIITIRDNGIGMNKQELAENLGTIARSGTQNFINQLSGDNKKDSLLIGQFGVGFYSAFMIADNIVVTSKKAGEDKAYVWLSDGKGEYTISDTDENFTRGTEVKLFIKPDEDVFLDHFRIKHIIKSYSDHIAVPIFFINDNDAETQINSGAALWTRTKSDISEEQYNEFYKTVSYSADNPWMTLHNKNEGVVDYTNLLFIPSTKTFDLFHPDRKCRIKLYIKRVFIGDETIDLIPAYLRFIRGVVDSEDLPLNINRESLQHNSTLEKIKRSITKRVISELKKRKDADLNDYLTFWNNFGAVLKEGLCEATSEHEKLLEVCLFRSALQDKFVTLDEYIGNANPEQKKIYFLSGDNADKLISSPQIEGFISKGIDVLLFTDTVDDFWVNVNNDYKGFEIKSVTRSDINLEEETGIKEDQKSTNNTETSSDNDADARILAFFKETLGNLVKDVQISKKLTSSPACLAVNAGAMDIRMERFLIEQKQLPSATAKILEINPNHSIIKKIAENLQEPSKQNQSNELVFLIFDQACIIEGEPVHDTAGFAKRINNIIESAVKV